MMKRYLSISILLHVLLLITAVGFHFATHVAKMNPGDSEINAINSYFYAESTPAATKSIEKATGIVLHHMMMARQANNQVAHMAAKASRASTQGEKTEGLLSLLHAAIQSTQTYPESAEEMGRQGRVSLQFQLSPDGTIQQLKILHTSGTQSLDEAALLAIHRAVPFKGVAQYINHPGQYQIDVVFEL